MKTTKMKYLLAILSWILIPNAAWAFDCSKAATRIELLICSTPDVFKLEEEMLAYHKQIVANKMPIVPAQKEWLRQRNSCKDVSCLRAAYYSRIILFKALLTSGASPPVNINPSVKPVQDGFTESESVSSAISQTTPTSVGPLETQRPATSQAHETGTAPPAWKESNPKPEIVLATRSEKLSLVTGKEVLGFLMGIVFLAATIGIYKSFRLPSTQSFMKSSLANLRDKRKQFKKATGRFFSPFRFWFITAPLVINTCWLLFNVAIFVSAIVDLGFFSPDCSLPSEEAHAASLYEPNILQHPKTNYDALHPECAPGKGGNKEWDIFAQRGFLIAYDVWAFLAVLYLDVKLILQKAPVTRHTIIPFCLAGNMVCSRIILCFFWPFKSFLSPLAPPNILMGLLLAGPIPPIVMVLLAPISIACAFGVFLSVISMVALPVMLLVNQVNIFIVERQRQELQTSGMYVWLMHLRHWLFGAILSTPSPDGNKNLRSTTNAADYDCRANVLKIPES